MHKPKLEDFLKSFQKRIDTVNVSYHDSKQQFEFEMKKFKDFRSIMDD